MSLVHLKKKTFKNASKKRKFTTIAAHSFIKQTIILSKNKKIDNLLP